MFFQRTEEEEDDAMQATEIQEYARQLFEAHGAKAIAERAKRLTPVKRPATRSAHKPGDALKRRSC